MAHVVSRGFAEKFLSKVGKMKSTICSLEGELGELVYDEYSKQARHHYRHVNELAAVEYHRGQMRGSTPVAATLVNSIIESVGWYVASPEELEQLVETSEQFNGKYEEYAIAWNTDYVNTTCPIAGLKTRCDSVPNAATTTIIPIAALTLRRDDQSPDGSVFELCRDINMSMTAISSLRCAPPFHVNYVHFTDNPIPPQRLINGTYESYLGISRLILGGSKKVVALNSNNFGISSDAGQILIATSSKTK